VALRMSISPNIFVCWGKLIGATAARKRPTVALLWLDAGVPDDPP
jgi:hypothetical protein